MRNRTANKRRKRIQRTLMASLGRLFQGKTADQITKELRQIAGRDRSRRPRIEEIAPWDATSLNDLANGGLLS